VTRQAQLANGAEAKAIMVNLRTWLR